VCPGRWAGGAVGVTQTVVALRRAGLWHPDVDRDPSGTAARAALTERARRWAAEQVGRDGRTVAGVAALLGVGWNTVMRAVRVFGQPLVDDPGPPGRGHRLGGGRAGVATRRAEQQGPVRDRDRGPEGVKTGRPAWLLDVVPGRTGTGYAAWIAKRDQAWRDRIELAALDPFRGYATALSTELPSATRVLNAFHVVKLGNQMVDEVRRRVLQQQLGHRGHRHDPLFEVRRLLRRGAEHLTDRQLARLGAALSASNPTAKSRWPGSSPKCCGRATGCPT